MPSHIKGGNLGVVGAVPYPSLLCDVAVVLSGVFVCQEAWAKLGPTFLLRALFRAVDGMLYIIEYSLRLSKANESLA